MRIIILGGTGLIGSAVASTLAQSGYEIIILTRNLQKYSNILTSYNYVYWDGQTSKGWIQWLEGDYAMINLAGESIAGERFTDLRWTLARKKSILESRLNAGQAVTEAIRTATSKPAVLIQASAIGYYGASLSGQEFTEKDAPGDDFLAYVSTKWERSTERVAEQGVRRVVIRIGVVLSNKGGALPKQIIPFRYYIGGTIGSGRQWYSWINIDDVAYALKFFIENAQTTGAFNICSPNPVTNKEFSKELAKTMQRPSWIPIPSFVLFHLLGEASKLLTQGQRVIPQRLLNHGYSFQYNELKYALRNLLSV